MTLEWKNLTDEALMIRFREGQSGAFEELLYRYKDRVYHYFLRLLSNKQAAEEAVQEVFLHLVRAAKKYEPRAKFGTWVYRIMHNYAIDLHRRNRLRRTLSLDQIRGGDDEGNGTSLLNQLADETPNLEEGAIDHDFHDHLAEALEHLNPDQREVFLMRENLGLPFHEIATILSVSTNTVKSRMRYALASLRKTLEPRFQTSKLRLAVNADIEPTARSKA